MYEEIKDNGRRFIGSIYYAPFIKIRHKEKCHTRDYGGRYNTKSLS